MPLRRRSSSMEHQHTLLPSTEPDETNGAIRSMELELGHVTQKTGKKTFVIVSFCVLLLAILGVAIYSKSDRSDQSNDSRTDGYKKGSNANEMTSDNRDGTDGSQYNDNPIFDGPKQVFCYGDSLTFGLVPSSDPFGVVPAGDPTPYASALREQLNILFTEEIVIDHVGFPGMTADQMLNRLEDGKVGACRIIDRRPNLALMVVLTGTNDILTMTETGTGVYRKILETIIELHRELLICADENKYMQTVIISIPGSEYLLHVRDAERATSYINNALENFAASNDRVNFIDFPIPYDSESANWSQDGIHLSNLGYKEMGKMIAPKIKQILDNIFAK